MAVGQYYAGKFVAGQMRRELNKLKMEGHVHDFTEDKGLIHHVFTVRAPQSIHSAISDAIRKVNEETWWDDEPIGLFEGDDLSPHVAEAKKALEAVGVNTMGKSGSKLLNKAFNRGLVPDSKGKYIGDYQKKMQTRTKKPAASYKPEPHEGRKWFNQFFKEAVDSVSEDLASVTVHGVDGIPRTQPVVSQPDAQGNGGTVYNGDLPDPTDLIDKMFNAETLAKLKERYGDKWHDLVTQKLASIPLLQPNNRPGEGSGQMFEAIFEMLVEDGVLSEELAAALNYVNSVSHGDSRPKFKSAMAWMSGVEHLYGHEVANKAADVLYSKGHNAALDFVKGAAKSDAANKNGQYPNDFHFIGRQNDGEYSQLHKMHIAEDYIRAQQASPDAPKVAVDLAPRNALEKLFGANPADRIREAHAKSAATPRIAPEVFGDPKLVADHNPGGDRWKDAMEGVARHRDSGDIAQVHSILDAVKGMPRNRYGNYNGSELRLNAEKMAAEVLASKGIIPRHAADGSHELYRVTKGEDGNLMGLYHQSIRNRYGDVTPYSHSYQRVQVPLEGQSPHVKYWYGPDHYLTKGNHPDTADSHIFSEF